MPTENYSPNWHVRCVSAPGPDTDLTLHVSFDNARYMFGCGEGTQRAYTQKKLGLKGMEAIFLSNAENRTRMGLPGVLMTAADGGISEISVVGPPDTSHFLGTFRSSVMRADFKVNPISMPIGKTSHDLTEMYQSPNVNVKAVSLVPPALRTAPRPADEPSVDMHTLRPDFSVTRPAALPRPELEAWRDLIVDHMFDRSRRTDRLDQPPGPFVRPDGTFSASWPESKFPLPLPTAEEQATELVYILEPPPVRGKFDVKRANELGVPAGPIRGRLVKGEDIEVDDLNAEGGKRIVRPADCLVGGHPGAVLIVVSCSPANLPSLLESTAFTPYQAAAAGTPEGRRVHMMVHRVISAVWRDPGYQSWMASFGPTTQHFLANHEVYSNDAYFRSAAWLSLDLGLIDSLIFPWVQDHDPNLYEQSPLPPATSILLPNHQVRMHPPGVLELLPNHDKDEPPPTKQYAHAGRRVSITQKPGEVQTARLRAMSAVRDGAAARDANSSSTPPPVGSDITITTLGTGSALPSKYRNVSATMLSIPNLRAGQAGSILLDCGEGTLGQMRRRYGPQGMRELYAELKMVFISHMHADHHLGLHSILEDRFKHGITTPLYVLGPRSIALHMQESASWQRPASDEALANVLFLEGPKFTRPVFRQKSAERSPPGSHGPSSPEYAAMRERFAGAPYANGQEDLANGVRRWPPADNYGNSDAINNYIYNTVEQLLENLDLESLHVPLVAHRGHANGLVLKHKSGWKVVYSGDTTPCDNLVKAGYGATLLIHEATLEDDKPEMAFRKGHSTFSQAIKVGKDMRARHILLNHFSQRYPKVPKLPTPSAVPRSPSSGSGSDGGNIEPVVSISFDLMSIKVSDMWKMAHYMEPISLLFPEEEEEGDGAEAAVAKDTNVSASEVAAKGGAAVKGKGKGRKEQNQADGHGRQNKKRKSPILPTDAMGETEDSAGSSQKLQKTDQTSRSRSPPRPYRLGGKQRKANYEAREAQKAPSSLPAVGVEMTEGGSSARNLNDPRTGRGKAGRLDDDDHRNDISGADGDVPIPADGVDDASSGLTHAIGDIDMRDGAEVAVEGNTEEPEQVAGEADV